MAWADLPEIIPGIGRDPEADPAAGPGRDELAAELDVADVHRERAARRPLVGGVVDRSEEQVIDPRPGRHAVAPPPLQRVAVERFHLHDLSPVGVEDGARRLAGPEEHLQVVVPRVAVGRHDREVAPRQRDRRRLRVDQDPVRQHDRAVLAGEVHARLVDAVGNRRPVVVPAVPCEPLRAGADVARADQGSDDAPPRVDDRQRQAVGAPQPEPDRRTPSGPGRDDLAHLRPPDRAADELQALRDRECRGGPAEQRDDENRRQETAQSGASVVASDPRKAGDPSPASCGSGAARGSPRRRRRSRRRRSRSGRCSRRPAC